MLPPYSCDWVHAPNFQRLADRAVTFDNCYAGSMPCMLVRRELHTGRYNFLHRSWGPLEPFDESLPEILKEHGVYSHLASDHQHYWEDGGATYHTPLFVWDSRCVAAGEHRGALVQTIDLMPTLLDLFGIKPSKNVEGVGLKETIASDAGDL